MVAMTSLPPYFESSKESQKWDDGFKAGLKELVPELETLKEETTDAATAEKLEALIVKTNRRAE
jgi:hypothetical protein